MSESSESILDHIAEMLRFISNTQLFWFMLDMSYDHGCHLASRFGLDPDEYEALLISACLAWYTRFGFQIKADALSPAATLRAAATAADAAMQRDGGIAVAAARRLRRWQQRDSATSAAVAPSANAPTHTRLRTPPTRRRTRLQPWSRTERQQRRQHRRCRQ